MRVPNTSIFARTVHTCPLLLVVEEYVAVVVTVVVVVAVVVVDKVDFVDVVGSFETVDEVESEFVVVKADVADVLVITGLVDC
jgi:hypothetical protein